MNIHEHVRQKRQTLLTVPGFRDPMCKIHLKRKKMKQNKNKMNKLEIVWYVQSVL